MRIAVLIATATFWLGSKNLVTAQVTLPVNGITDQRYVYHAFTNVALWIDYRQVLDSATLIIYDGKITAAGKGIPVPKDAVVHNMSGKTIYPSFIDLDTQYGIIENTPGEKTKGQQHTSATKGAFSWNQALKPETAAHKNFVVNDKQAAQWRKGGFGSVLTYHHDGIARGTAAFVMLGDNKEQEMIIRDKAAACYSFRKGISQQDYPTSEMGAIALLRQSYLDAQWYKNGGYEREFNISINAWNENQAIPQIFDAENKFQSLRIDKIGDEFAVKFAIIGSGDEYQLLEEIKNTGNSYILPLKFPPGYDLSDPYEIPDVSLEELKHWEMAPANAFLLNKAGVEIAFTSKGLKEPSEFLGMLRKVVSYGLPENEAIRACTETPARILGVSDKLGALRPGMLANFIVTSGDLFKNETILFENWIKGVPYPLNASSPVALQGTYQVTLDNGQNFQIRIGGTQSELKGKVGVGSDTVNATISYSNFQVSVKFEIRKEPGKGTYLLSGYQSDSLGTSFAGDGLDPLSKPVSWSAVKISSESFSNPPDTTQKEKPEWGPLWYPNKAFGFKEIPVIENVLFRNITVWTNEKEGILENADVLINGGKIARVGKNLDAGEAVIIDGTGKHLTAGIIDEHSHIAVSGNVNECSHSVTSEVRIGDVINSDDINIYRQLVGGVTTSQLLHGSCNAIGGQSALIKLRWGMPPEKMKFDGADGFIKFALGENVKQTNFGDEYKTRYPQTRMGVEQVYYDAFHRAKEYTESLKKPKGKKSLPPRRNLRLEALAEILDNKRFITCHSYQQGEINMLMHVADSMGFRVNTFTHILEGYKVADKMKKHGVGASSFSDWWGYKYEVIEAIPYNGPIMHDAGLIVAYNSDDPEMARRLNQEAAKAVKYGSVSEEEALKFVTLNPAKLLHIDHRVGSIKAGKDADVVLWSDNPLSVYAKVLMTFVDGKRYYDTERDKLLQKEIEEERARIISKMLKEKGKSKPGELKKPQYREEQIKHCIDDEDTQ